MLNYAQVTEDVYVGTLVCSTYAQENSKNDSVIHAFVELMVLIAELRTAVMSSFESEDS